VSAVWSVTKDEKSVTSLETSNSTSFMKIPISFANQQYEKKVKLAVKVHNKREMTAFQSSITFC